MRRLPPTPISTSHRAVKGQRARIHRRSPLRDPGAVVSMRGVHTR